MTLNWGLERRGRGLWIIGGSARISNEVSRTKTRRARRTFYVTHPWMRMGADGGRSIKMQELSQGVNVRQEREMAWCSLLRGIICPSPSNRTPVWKRLTRRWISGLEHF